jgi:hypothetical protein
VVRHLYGNPHGRQCAFDVSYATADGTATVADGDYVAKSGTLHFDANVYNQMISVTINGGYCLRAIG